MNRKRPRSVYCSPEEHAAIRERAAAAGLPVSRFLLERAQQAREEAGSGPAAALTEAERAELHDGVRVLSAFADLLRGGGPKSSGPGAPPADAGTQDRGE